MKHDPRCQGFPSKEAIQKNIDGPLGVHLTGVLGEDGPSFVYTTGLFAKYGFELFMIGLAPSLAAHILNGIAKGLKEGEKIYINVPDSRWANLPLKFMPTDPDKQDKYPVNVSKMYYDLDNLLVYQLVMCDREEKFPDEPGFDHEYMDHRQPLLY